MTSKTITRTFRRKIAVHSGNEFDDYVPESAVVQIADAQARRYLELGAEVQRLGVYKIADWDYTPHWAKVGGESPRVDCETVNVTDTNIQWKAYMKYSDTPISTDSIPLADLAAFFGFATPPNKEKVNRRSAA